MKKILCFFLFLIIIPQVSASEPFPPGTSTIIGIGIGAAVIFFLLGSLFEAKMDSKFIGEIIGIFIGATIAVSVVYAGLYSTPEAPLYRIQCGNRVCDALEIFDCPWDCGYLCGNDICESNPPFSEYVSCPQDCDLNNSLFINQLKNDMFRPLTAGVEISNLTNLCSIGAIFNLSGYNHVITAGHCFTEGNTIFQPDPICTIDYGNGTIISCNQTQSTVIGYVNYSLDTGGYQAVIDMAIINLTNITGAIDIDVLNNTIDCIADSFALANSFAVYKIGRTTGLTFANWTGEGLFESDACHGRNSTDDVDDCTFTDFGDSGAGIITLTRPRQLVGIVSRFNDDYYAVGNTTFYNYTGATSMNLSQIKALLPDVPVCPYNSVFEDPPFYPDPIYLN